MVHSIAPRDNGTVHGDVRGNQSEEAAHRKAWHIQGVCDVLYNALCLYLRKGMVVWKTASNVAIERGHGCRQIRLRAQLVWYAHVDQARTVEVTMRMLLSNLQHYFFPSFFVCTSLYPPPTIPLFSTNCCHPTLPRYISTRSARSAPRHCTEFYAAGETRFTSCNT